MTTVYVREVSDEAITALKTRASRAHQSLQTYMRELIEREAAVPTLEEASAQAARVAALNTSSEPVDNRDVLDAIDAGRAGR